MDNSEVPPFFICPISQEIMKEPVTLSTGMTYDRESICRWIFDYGHQTCPVTQQTLDDVAVTPNSTLLRLIQQWEIDHPQKVVIASTTNDLAPSFDVSIIPELVEKLRQPQLRIKALKKIKLLIQESDANRRCMRESEVDFVVASLVAEMEQRGIIATHYGDNLTTIDVAMNVLYLLKPSRETLKKIGEESEGKIVATLALVLQKGSYQGRIYSALLLKHIFKVIDNQYKSELPPEFFDAMVEILKDQNSNRATMAILSILIELTPYSRNQIKAIEAGVVAVLVELLAESGDRRSCELMLGVLETLCSKAEGRSAFSAHAAGLAAVVGKILTVSHVASEMAVKILLHLCKFCVKGVVVDEMVEVGGVARLCMVVQADCSRKSKEKAKEILALHFKTWSKSPCFSFYML